MRVKVDKSQLQFKEWLGRVEKASDHGTKKIAESYRDRLRENFVNSSAGADYPIMKGNHTLENFLVVSDRHSEDYFTVGPKIGGMKTTEQNNFRTYEEIFEMQEKGTINAEKDIWTFKLVPNRQHLSDDGFWTTRGMRPKRFMEKTYNEYSKGKLQQEAQEKIAPLVRRELDK